MLSRQPVGSLCLCLFFAACSETVALDAAVVGDDALGSDVGLSDASDDAAMDAFVIAADDAAEIDALAHDAFGADAFVPGPSDAGPDAAGPGEGPDAAVSGDAGPVLPTCSGADLDLASVPGASALVISEIDPGVFIEVYNNTDSELELSSTSYQLCSPFVYVALATLGEGITVPARGFAHLPWPPRFSDTDAGGEIILYTNTSFGSSASMMSFVCWGTNPHGTRLATALAGGRWAGSCASAITPGRSLTRLPGNSGSEASHYVTDASPTPERCGPAM